MKIFGREPALYLGAITAALSLVVGFSALTGEQAALIIAAIVAVGGAVQAALTRPIRPAAFSAVVAALAALVAGFGHEVDPSVVAGVAACTVALLALVTRGQVSPARDVDPAVLGGAGYRY